ncbi:hypothetical protein BU25DRAFT_122886 [Macroventuria anomochaeta]|uniref:Uncharacterized protein n=1 Tax=Macroventuria anomochaeta TaxID=301207 RepID=A0ACB6RT62_9PLEO|nr:uncharacterized protein BU25DRAFT_122886 [Macroventuria anomochaeta]KAF2625106.1 hypothetical protein BU25DRAFT_122886 [Macroventuria anomochaeta]
MTNRASHFVYAWYVHLCCLLEQTVGLKNVNAISTYGGRGTVKAGCRASSHTFVYNQGSRHVCFAGERERGMIKDPIMVDTTDPDGMNEFAFRIRLHNIYSIEWSVRVRDIEVLTGRDKTKPLRYFRGEQCKPFRSDSEDEDP